MKDGEVAFKVVYKIELHLCYSCMIKQSRFHVVIVLTEQGPSLRCDHFDRDWALLCFSGNIAACCYDQERIGFTVGIFEVKSFEENRSSSNNTLAEGELPAEFYDGIGEVNAQKIEILWVVDM